MIHTLESIKKLKDRGATIIYTTHYMEEVEEISTTIIMDHNEEFLTNKETEVMLEISKGLSNKEIAEKLCISLATVKTHIINIYSKLQVNSRVAAVEKARKMDIIKN